ncbi:MlaD family protein [Rhodococcus sp. HNM0569]|uniref:MlaD family protein n=1 Tax=Rhodococcus sp. HNM0569 TaxID=2716340 RepID=UPI003211E410
MKATGSRVVAAVGAGLAVAVTLTGCGVGMQDLPLGRSAGGDAYDVTVQLATAEGLVLGADVRTGQEVIGRVAELRPDTIGALVTLSLDDSVELPQDVRASVELPSALGSPFIRLIPPDDGSGARPLRDGDLVPESSTEIGPQIENALATLGTVVSGSGFGQLDTVVRELNTAFAGRSQDVRGLTTQLTELMAAASAQQGEFDHALAVATEVSGKFAAQQAVVDGYLDSLPDVVDVLVRQKDSISSLLDSTAQLSTNARTVLSSSSSSLDGMLHDASTVVATLESFNDRIGGTLTNMNQFLETFQVSVKGDYLAFDGALDIPGGIDKLLTGGLSRTVAASPVPGASAAPPTASAPAPAAGPGGLPAGLGDTLSGLLSGGSR